ncbi:hypothetical protein HJG60_008688 [Phyllostomus discolor]|uniref:Uncharacterized protein n=1 Tax=Phyllostomus discolor TaxID=89673 RepID=A0A834DKI8_9CHIR|nr:hypothetical protein HJG60_008688 [Phyllostomus discolor]
MSGLGRGTVSSLPLTPTSSPRSPPLPGHAAACLASPTGGPHRTPMLSPRWARAAARQARCLTPASSVPRLLACRLRPHSPLPGAPGGLHHRPAAPSGLRPPPLTPTCKRPDLNQHLPPRGCPIR